MVKLIREDEHCLTLQVEHFNLLQTFECGQCFRWEQKEDNHFVGIVKGKVISICQEEQYIRIRNMSRDELSETFMDYFDLHRDYSKIIDSISKENTMKMASEYGSGIRLLKQDEWETLISFILSSNNNIPRIKKIIKSLCERWGDKITYEGQTYYSFPTAKQLQHITSEDLKEIKCGYRASYILDAIQKVNDKSVDLYYLKEMDTGLARKELMKIKGVGPKVADCILLFSMGKYESYPMDVWIKKVMEKYFFEREATPKEIQKFASTTWGDMAGFAQQYLFYYARDHM